MLNCLLPLLPATVFRPSSGPMSSKTAHRFYRLGQVGAHRRSSIWNCSSLFLKIKYPPPAARPYPYSFRGNLKLMDDNSLPPERPEGLWKFHKSFQ